MPPHTHTGEGEIPLWSLNFPVIFSLSHLIPTPKPNIPHWGSLTEQLFWLMALKRQISRLTARMLTQHTQKPQIQAPAQHILGMVAQAWNSST